MHAFRRAHGARPRLFIDRARRLPDFAAAAGRPGRLHAARGQRALSFRRRDRRLPRASRENARGQDPAAQSGDAPPTWPISTASSGARPQASASTCFRSATASSSAFPAAFTFDAGSAAVKPQTDATLLEIARTVKTRNQTFVDVLAHTDTTGTPQVNQALSEKRAAAVATYLAGHGVAQGADRLARAWRERTALQSGRRPKPRKRPTAGSKSGWSRTAASAARRRSARSSSAASASPMPPSTSGR